MRECSTAIAEASASAQIWTGAGRLEGADLIPPASGAATLKIYDSDSSTITGKPLLATIQVQTALNSANLSTLNVACTKGIYAVLSGTTTFSVRYIPG